MRSGELDAFLYDEEKVFRQYIQELSSLVKVGEKDHSIIILVPDNKVSTGDRIAIYLIGRYVRHKMGLDESPSASNKQIAYDLRIPVNIVNARIKELKDSNIVSSTTKGEYRVSFIRIEDFLKRIRGKVTNSE